MLGAHRVKAEVGIGKFGLGHGSAGTCLSRLAAGAPSAFGPDGRVVGVDPELAQQMSVVRSEMQRLALFISSHPWIAGSGNRYAAWQQVDQAAKAPAGQ